MEAYPVPFHLDRSRKPDFVLQNRSAEKLRGVTVLLTGRGVLAAPVAVSLRPLERMRVSVRGDDLERDSACVVRWLRQDGSEYLWRFVL